MIVKNGDAKVCENNQLTLCNPRFLTELMERNTKQKWSIAPDDKVAIRRKNLLPPFFISFDVYSLTLGGFSPPCVKGGVSGRSEQLNILNK